MINVFKKVFYGLRILLFIIHLIMNFMLLSNIIRLGVLGYLFLFLDCVYVINIISELLSQKEHYKNDIYYNIMQIGIFIYISIIWLKLSFNNNFVYLELLDYLNVNYIVLSILMLFLISYSLIVFNKKNKDL